MKSHAVFYKKQRKGRFFFWFTLLMFLLFPTFIILISAQQVPTWSFYYYSGDDLFLSIIIPILLIGYIILLIFILKRFWSFRKSAYTRYQTLSEEEKDEVDGEIADIQQIKFGKKRMYFYCQSYLQLIDYGEITSYELINVFDPVVQHKPNQLFTYDVVASSKNARLTIYTRAGERYTIDRLSDLTWVLGQLKAHAPDAVGCV